MLARDICPQLLHSLLVECNQSLVALIFSLKTLTQGIPLALQISASYSTTIDGHLKIVDLSIQAALRLALGALHLVLQGLQGRQERRAALALGA
jgi:hypothetical protein